jgi:hypothetical protein
MSIIDQEIDGLWTAFHLARGSAQPDCARLLLKISLLYLHVRGLQSAVRVVMDETRGGTAPPLDLDDETDKTWSVLSLGYKYGSPDFERLLFKKALRRMFASGLRHTRVQCRP